MIRRHLFRLLQRNLGYPLDEDVVYCHYDFVKCGLPGELGDHCPPEKCGSSMPNLTTCRPGRARGGVFIPISEFLALFGFRFIATYPL